MRQSICKKHIFEYIIIALFASYILFYYMFGANSNRIIYSEIILMAFLGLAVISLFKDGKIRYNAVIIILFAFVAYCFLSNFWAINSKLALDKAKTLFILAVFLLIAYNFFAKIENSEKIILKILCWCGIIFSIYVIVYYGIENYFTRLIAGERLGEEINNVNMIGLQTSIAVIICFFYALYENKYKYYIYSIIPLIVSLGTGSRKVVVLIALGILLLFTFNKSTKLKPSKKIRKYILLIMMIFALVYIASLPMFSTIFSRMQTLINFFKGNGKVDNSAILRHEFIKAGLNQFIETPLFGIGINNSQYITLKVSGFATYLHNNYVELLSCTGILGFCLYYGTFVYLIIKLLKQVKTKDKMAIISLIILLIVLILDYGMVSYYLKSTYLYILFTMMVTNNKEKLYDKKNIEDF